MNESAAVRSARTIVTGAGCKGRMDGYQRMQDAGVILEKQWMSAHDTHTRDWHAALDGVTKPIDESFENEFGEIMYPGDPTAHGANVYNCRCAIAAVVKGFRSVKASTNNVQSAQKSFHDAGNRSIIKREQEDFLKNAPCITTPKKFAEYFLKRGAKHAEQFFDVGYTENDVLQLQYDIAKQLDMSKAVNFSKNKYGEEKFRIYMNLGVSKKKKFRAARQKDTPNSKPHIITAFREDE